MYYKYLKIKIKIFKIAVSFLFFSSCIVQSPKYTTFEKVTALEIGMTKERVEKVLEIEPYNIKQVTDSSCRYIYVYRVNDRRTLLGATKPLNGKRTLGKYTQLIVTYSKNDIVTGFESCTQCPDDLERTRKVDVEKVILFITVTLPILLVYFGLKN